MRWVGRMLALLIAALLLAVGAVGQVATIGTEAAENWAQRIRDPLVARVGSELVGRGLALAAAAPVRYGVPGVGLVLMFFVLKPRRRSSETDEARDPFDAVVGLDARLVKKTIRQANRLARKGIRLESYLTKKNNKTGEFPRYFVTIDGGEEIEHHPDMYNPLMPPNTYFIWKTKGKTIILF